jgi:hypothetical protein
MRSNRALVLLCRQCGNQVSFPAREANRDANFTVTCLHCGFIDLTMNITGQAIYNRLKELGRTNLKEFAPQPIDPISVTTLEDGSEIVVRRYKNGREHVRHRTRRS